MTRKIAIMTGSRADYGILYPVIKAIQEHPGLEPVLLITGTHLSRYYGYTIRGIKKDKFKIGTTVDMHISKGDNLENMAESFGYCVIGMAKALKKIKDLLLSPHNRDSLADHMHLVLLIPAEKSKVVISLPLLLHGDSYSYIGMFI